MNTRSLMRKRKMGTLQEYLYTTYSISIEARQKYEEELKMTYVLEKKIANMEDEIRNLKVVTRPVTKLKDHGDQTKDDILVVGEAQHMDIDEWDGAKEVEIKTIKKFLMHKIGTLHVVSQIVHNNYISLQGDGYKCSEALDLLSPLFTT